MADIMEGQMTRLRKERDEARAELKTVLDRETATTARFDARIEGLEAQPAQALRIMVDQPDPVEKAGMAVLAFLKRCEGVRMPIMASDLVPLGQIGLVVRPDVYRWLSDHVEKQEASNG